MRKSRIILVGAAGSGKDFLRDKFIKRGFIPDISVTTRPMRDDEEDGKTYHYITETEFEVLEREGLLYESVQFNGWNYGTLKQSWESSDIFIMTPSGIGQIKMCERIHCLIIYLDIPEDVRRERIARRSDADSVERRLKADRKDFAGFNDFDIRITQPDF